MGDAEKRGRGKAKKKKKRVRCYWPLDLKSDGAIK